MPEKLKTVQNSDDICVNQKLVELVKHIMALCYRYEGHRQPMMALIRANARAFTYYQGFMKKFNSLCDVVDQQGGTFCEP